MNWNSLLNNKCPKCGAGVSKSAGESVWLCDLFGQGKFFGCDFTIGDEKLQALKAKIGDRKYHKETERDNASELNNYGHTAPSEDFSDSPYLNG